MSYYGTGHLKFNGNLSHYKIKKYKDNFMHNIHYYHGTILVIIFMQENILWMQLYVILNHGQLLLEWIQYLDYMKEISKHNKYLGSMHMSDCIYFQKKMNDELFDDIYLNNLWFNWNGCFIYIKPTMPSTFIFAIFHRFWSPKPYIYIIIIQY